MLTPPVVSVVREAGGVRGEQLSQLQRPAGSRQQLQAAHQDHTLHARGGYSTVQYSTVQYSTVQYSDQLAAVNSCRLLTRIIPFMLEVGIMIW